MILTPEMFVAFKFCDIFNWVMLIHSLLSSRHLIFVNSAKILAKSREWAEKSENSSSSLKTYIVFILDLRDDYFLLVWLAEPRHYLLRPQTRGGGGGGGYYC